MLQEGQLKLPFQVNMLLVNHSALNGLKKFKSDDLDVRRRPPNCTHLLDEVDTATQQQTADQLNVTRETISILLKDMGKMQKMGKWVPHELNERQQEKRNTTCEMKSIYILRILSL
ncbi:mariner Mos1 transposase [Caerostris darwini]|uniref:Mariner Mos1 transposase n=1 Tax=Caerostris darwini TaxID=1538125 RepID=A0AAV4UBC1_9ARAC|nr:mariner Mos1 transposase [Caerostris darwini]